MLHVRVREEREVRGLLVRAVRVEFGSTRAVFGGAAQVRCGVFVMLGGSMDGHGGIVPVSRVPATAEHSLRSTIPESTHEL